MSISNIKEAMIRLWLDELIVEEATCDDNNRVHELKLKQSLLEDYRDLLRKSDEDFNEMEL